MKLTALLVKRAKPGAKTRRMADGGGLYLEVRPNGSKYWRLAYRFQGKQKTLALGVYPAVSLLEARAERDKAKALLRAGTDPGQARKIKKAVEPGKDGFEVIAMEWFSKQKAVWGERHAQTIIGRLQKHVFPFIGAMSLHAIAAPDLLALLQKIEARGNMETARRVKQICGQVFRYAIATGRADRNPAADLRGALTPPRTKHMASLTNPQDVAGLLRAIDNYQGSFITRCALRLAPLVFVRPGELRRAEWVEINLDAAEWRIPAEKMKMKTAHLVPLSSQAVAVLQEIFPLTGNGQYVFPSERSRARAMSSNTINAALRRMGYTKDEMTGHGFRSMASTLLNEQGWNRDAIERQLAHQERNKVRAAYNFAEMLPERREMMQGWADYLDQLKADGGSNVVPIRGYAGR